LKIEVDRVEMEVSKKAAIGAAAVAVHLLAPPTVVMEQT
jgi:hypothetical protein